MHVSGLIEGWLATTNGVAQVRMRLRLIGRCGKLGQHQRHIRRSENLGGSCLGRTKRIILRISVVGCEVMMGM